MKNQLLVLLLACVLASCNSARRQAEAIAIEFGQKPTIVYKTKADYRQYVPVLLTEDRQSLLSYPAPQDLYADGELALPLPLEDGYLLDRRGIGPQVAFLDMTYEEYAQLPKPPAPSELLARVQEAAPLLECYDCGSVRSAEQLNILIRGKGLAKCRRLE